MLYFNRINVSEGVNIKKTSTSKECIVCYCWQFLDKEFKFQLNVCNACYDVLMMSMNFSSIAFLNILAVDYSCIIDKISKSETIALLNNENLNEKSETSSNIKNYCYV